MIHPGYGFSFERMPFARACEDAGIIFVGPTPDLLEKMGDKVAAKKAADLAGGSHFTATPNQYPSQQKH